MAKLMKHGSVENKKEEDERIISMYTMKEMIRLQQETMFACFNSTVKKRFI